MAADDQQVPVRDTQERQGGLPQGSGKRGRSRGDRVDREIYLIIDLMYCYHLSGRPDNPAVPAVPFRLDTRKEGGQRLPRRQVCRTQAQVEIA